MAVKNLNELFENIKSIVKEVMENEVSKDMENIMKEQVDKIVYDAYQPTHYKRTGQLKDNVKATMIDNETLILKSDRKDGDRDVVRVVEEGKGYTWGYVRRLDIEIGPRPFVAKTKEKIESNNLHIESLKNGLKKRSINTE